MVLGKRSNIVREEQLDPPSGVSESLTKLYPLATVME